MFAKERQAAICELIKKESAITTAELTKKFNISLETARRDLVDLEKEGVLKRVHGGAIYESEMKPFFNLEKRNQSNIPQKEELCKIAACAVNEGEIIGVDSGSTAIFFAKELARRFSGLTVITHSLDVFEMLCRHRDFKIILCAGHFLPEENAFYGPLVTESIRSIHVQKFFMFPSAISLSSGICDFEHNLAAVAKQFCDSASEIYVLADSSKFETYGLLSIREMSPTYTYVTDSGLPENLKKLYMDNHIRIITTEKEL